MAINVPEKTINPAIINPVNISINGVALTIIEDIFMTLIYKKFGEERENFSVIVNMEKGEIEIYQEMIVVKNVVDPISEIHIDEARNEYEDLDVGDVYINIIMLNK